MNFIQKIVKKLTRGEKVQVLYGYPSFKKCWLTVYHYRGSDEWQFEWDDLFADVRPSSWGDISQCLMFDGHKNGATKQEIEKAWDLLKKRNLALNRPIR
ncbi:hypothetical protein KVQ01_11335 [Escherichia coli]|uniref:hypothetical protein n=1 Tax=Escherichia coli TaxID=562 RepID=UPI001F051DC2|nr:hypothetical protein [Escherichia coli]MCH0685612.1 hypothetical protein [Escherichia coli]MDZ8667112.1 hypothetical protein [Escherichia coli]WRX87694.1 hypothetical protein SM938_22465 [Escherichia coli]